MKYLPVISSLLSFALFHGTTLADDSGLFCIFASFPVKFEIDENFLNAHCACIIPLLIKKLFAFPFLILENVSSLLTSPSHKSSGKCSLSLGISGNFCFFAMKLHIKIISVNHKEHENWHMRKIWVRATFLQIYIFCNKQVIFKIESISVPCILYFITFALRISLWNVALPCNCSVTIFL